MNDRQKISRTRQQLREALAKFAARGQVSLAERGPLVKGLFQSHGTRCGKPNCRCAQGELHPTAVLVLTENGRRRNIYVPLPDRPEMQRRSQRYRRVRQARADLVKLMAEILALNDELVELLSEPYVPKPRGKRSSAGKQTKK